MNDSALLTVRGLEKTYTGTAESLTILKNLDMTVDAGTKNIITGESGCGKSTLLNIIGGLDTLTAGFVRAGSYQVSSLDENGLTEYRANFLGLIFQFHYLLKDFTALENVFLPAYMTGMSKKNALERAEQLLCDVSLENRMHHLPSQLSGGERQRAAVARALINNPELILADEPTGNLDPANAAVVSDVLFSMVEKYHKTLVLVTHDHELAKRADVCYRLTGGKLERV